MTTQNSSQEKPRRGPLGWSFTGREERMMANAMRLSIGEIHAKLRQRPADNFSGPVTLFRICKILTNHRDRPNGSSNSQKNSSYTPHTAWRTARISRRANSTCTTPQNVSAAPMESTHISSMPEKMPYHIILYGHGVAKHCVRAIPAEPNSYPTATACCAASWSA